MTELDIDGALHSLGKFSKWQMLLYITIGAVICIKGGWHMLAIVFVGGEPDTIHCALPEGVDVNTSIPFKLEDGVSTMDQCHVYVNYSMETNKSIPCSDGWHYSDYNNMYSIVNQWDLICDKAWMNSISQTILTVGVLVGALVMAQIGDKYGRKIGFLISCIGISIVDFITAWSPSIYMFLPLRFFTGFFQSGVILCGFILCCELFPASQRTWAGLLMQCGWPIALAIMAALAYLIPNWSHFLITISAPGLLVIPFFWFVPKSVPWLVAMGRLKEAQKILEAASKMCGKTLPERFRIADVEPLMPIYKEPKEKTDDNENTKNGEVQPKGKEENSAEITYTIVDIFKSRRLALITLIMMYIWLVNTLVYYGLSLSTGSLAGDRYTNFALSSIVEFFAYVIAAVCLQFIGRRYPICVFQAIAGVFLFISAFIPKTTGNGTDLSALLTACAFIGKFGIAGSFGSVFLYAPEMFPTTVRSIGMGLASVAGRIGALVAPFTMNILKVAPWFVGVVYGGLCLVAAVATLYLPETLHRPLPHTIEEVENWSRTLSPEEKAAAKRKEKGYEAEPVPDQKV